MGVYKQTLGVAFPIESISRKFALRRETAGAKSLSNGAKTIKVPSTKFMGGMVRQHSVVSGNNQRTAFRQQLLFIKKYNRSTPLSTDEVRLRNNFSKVATAVAALMKDLSQISRIQMTYSACLADNRKTLNGVSVVGYGTVRDWVFAVQYAGLKDNPEYDVTVFPQLP